MTKTRLDNKAEWVALVAAWIAGVSHDDDNLRSTATQKELADTLSVPAAARADFEQRGLSTSTRGYAEMIASNAEVRPPSYPCVVSWEFVTVPFAEISRDSFLFMDSHISFVTKEDLE